MMCYPLALDFNTTSKFVAMHTSTISKGTLNMFMGLPIGAKRSASTREPIVQARLQLAQHLWHKPDITRWFLLAKKLCSKYIVSERGLIDNIKLYMTFFYISQFELSLHF